MKFMSFIIGLLLFFLTEIKAQNAIPASGGDAIGTGGTACYTVGQVVYTNITGLNGSVLQGIQQPYEISVVSGVETTTIELACNAYPNPTTDKLILWVEITEKLNLTYQLLDISGKLLESKKVESSEICISMGSRTPSIYFLKVFDGVNEVKTFKIIKN